MRYRLLVVLTMTPGLWACSGSAPGDASAGNGGAAGSMGGVAAGGAPVASAGGPQANAGTAGALAAGGTLGTAGAGANAAGASGDTSGTSACPVWPRTRLMPIIGPFFYGMDPGPCADVGYTYTYEAGRLLTRQNRATQATSTFEYDAQGLLTGSTSTDASSSVFEFGADYVLDVEKGPDGSITSQIRYALTANGYPTTFSLDSLGEPTRYGSYAYDNCRLFERTRDVGTTIPEKVSYAYDSEGHVSARTCVCSSDTTFDYSCW